ncbi:MAG TPA: RNA polymerase factor sigma-54 [Bacillota bacterium]|nr:RNA polymerase factor sigma-54 [Bacillota bacterium]HQE65711.1 RNA polymerase factor sigma-54 [Bacillota bacterium]HQJ36346.1 RNA polymerase factor sigma-54 [Bacillota bacterium]HQL35992.1 RNA polymerase factor sigma-54 [Bacillota bacterium]
MRMGYDLLIEQQQKLIMTPELKLALKILQLPAVELEELLQQELENNPVLELVDDSRDEKSEAQQKLDKKEKEKEKEKEIDWKEYFQFQGKSYSEEGFDNDEASELSYENFITYSYTLKDHLISQLRVSQISKKLRDIGEYIIESLDENGYLTITKEDLAAILDAEPEAVEEALSVIQTFEPFGVGASNLKECLLIQLRNKDIKDKKIEAIIMNHLDDIASNRISNISKKLSISIEEAQKYSDIIKSLEPKPGRAFEEGTSTKYVTPDVYIEKVGKEYIVIVNDYYGSKLTINQFYKKMLISEDKSSQASAFISNKLSSAMWLIKSLEHRKNTLYNVVKAILDYQMDFFEKGPMFLKTMTLKKIAEMVNVHESTVSRAINGKYVQTPRGIFEIKYFFKSGVDNQDGEAISSESIKKKIKGYVCGEDASKPLSDQQIADLLVKEGYMISRRTVAKYRDELGILSSSKRKRY